EDGRRFACHWEQEHCKLEPVYGRGKERRSGAGIRNGRAALAGRCRGPVALFGYAQSLGIAFRPGKGPGRLTTIVATGPGSTPGPPSALCVSLSAGGLGPAGVEPVRSG